ncbi:hypothetical protein [Bradyrhizobium vignae]|uniref:Uncharacterized protein n=1 Tax=Bradyrhizobium vignae TaxID=1549949 RepID=A0A2U3PVG3_9BRAD|nr:hypothetical protein [Bradyrhizobium vignae]MBP0113591.1 hypothetical protein [Bradyrhizobium vignae]SPP93151.1 conserved protein of unknown function [Bradyrhizobium vignae]
MSSPEDDRREFLRSCGRFACVTPPKITALLSTSLTSSAITTSEGRGRVCLITGELASAERSDQCIAEAKRYRDKAAEAEQLAELAVTAARRQKLTIIARTYLRTAAQLESVAEAIAEVKRSDCRSKVK